MNGNLNELIPGARLRILMLACKWSKRIGKDIEVDGTSTSEHWNAPVYLPGEQTVTATSIHVTWYPGRKVSF